MLLLKRRYVRLAIYILFDLFASFFSVPASLLFMGDWPVEKYSVLYSSCVFAVVMFVLLYIFKVYNILWRYAGIKDYVRLFFASIVSVLVVFIVQRALWQDSFTKSSFFATFVFSSLIICSSRLYIKYRRKNRK